MSYTQRDFLHAVLSHSGLPCIAFKKPAVKGMQHHVATTIDAAVAYLETSRGGHDYYFGISTLSAPSILDRGTMRVRTQSNALSTRCFVLDIDIHPEDGDTYYTSQDEGREGLQRLIEALDMPQPIVVNSGYGLHVYWPMAEGVPSAEWQGVANRFKRVVQLTEPKLAGDGSRIADSAGVLRIPGTYNLKNGLKVPVEIEQWSDEILDFGEFARKMELNGGPMQSLNVPSISLDVAREEMEPVQLTSLVKNCNWVKQYLKNPEEADEPQWYAMMGLAPFVQHQKADGTQINGAQIAHLFSKGHSTYSPGETDKKFQQAQMGQTGPTTCVRFQGIKLAGCAGCPFIGEVKSPASAARLSRPITEPKAVTTQVISEEGTRITATVHIPVPPKPYFRGEDGGVYVRTNFKEEDGSFTKLIQKVYDYDLYPTRRYRTENIETEALEICLHLPHDGMRKFKMPTEHLADQKKLSSFLTAHGVVGEFGQAKPMAKYMVDYVRDMQMNQAAEIEFSRFGWRDIVSDHPKFVVGNGYIGKDGSLQPGSFAYFLKQASLCVAAVGDLEKWKKAFNVYKGIPGSEAFQMCALLGFASPLLALTEYRGVLFNMVGHGGAGKSTALRIMSSVWGQPNENHLRITDNEIPMYNLIGYLNCVPVAFDELTKWDPDKLGKFVLNLTGGRGKMRATRSGANAANETEWDTIVACSSNTSLYNKLSEARTGYNAEAMRVYEVNVPEGDKENKHLFTEANAVLLKNYGVAGRVYMEWLIKNLLPVQQAVEKAMANLDRSGARKTDERFWVALLATLQVSGKITRKMGLHNYDVDHLVAWASGQSVEVRAEINATHAQPLNILSDFFNNTLDGTLHFRNGAVDLSGPSTFLRSVQTRIEYEGTQMKTAIISVSALRNYCLPRTIDMAWLKRGLLDSGVLVDADATRRLATGTTLPNTPTRSWIIDMAHPKLNEIELSLLPENDNGTAE